jgi:hypothetical protein
MLSNAVTKFNGEVATENSTTFMKMLKKGSTTGFNYTMVQAPSLSAASDLFSFELDGTFYDFSAKSNHVDEHANTPAYNADSHKEQFYLHQSTVNSFFFALEKNYMPLSLNKPSISAQLLQLLPEIGMKFGDKTNLALDVSILPLSKTPFQFDTKAGLRLGANDDVKIQMVIYANSTSTPTPTLACVFEMYFTMNGNITGQNWIILPNIQEIKIHNTTVSNDTVGMSHRNYDGLFSTLIEAELEDFNAKYYKGIDLRTVVDPNIAMAFGFFTNATISPYVAEGNYYLGFNFMMDRHSAYLQAAHALTQAYFIE